MNRLIAQLRRTFSALSVPNFRRFFTGQSISLVGTWMQSVAQSWLVYSLTRSSTDLGLVVAIQTLPVLLIGPYGGLIADRVDKRRLMVFLQTMMGVQALVLGVLAVTHLVTFWEVCLLALALGMNNCFENPARQSFVLEMVGAANVRNAVSLNSTMVNAARAVGPAIAGLVIATAGVGVCFLLNAVSFVAVVFSLVTMDVHQLQPSPPARRARGQLREGFRYVAHQPQLGVPLLMMALVGTLAYEFQVSLPVFASKTFHGGPETYGFLTAAMGAGAVLGGLITASRGKTGVKPMTVAVLGFGLAILLTSVSPVLGLAYGGMALVGWGSVSFMATGNSSLQLAADPSMRGRVMALWAVAFMGSTPIGGPLIGWVIAAAGARVGLGVGGASCVVAAFLGVAVMVRLRSRRQALRPTSAGPYGAPATAITTSPVTTSPITTSPTTTSPTTTAVTPPTTAVTTPTKDRPDNTAIAIVTDGAAGQDQVQPAL